jgi:hypothetical protein
MRGEQLELERWAREVRRRAGFDELDLVSSLTIAKRAMGVEVLLNPSLHTQACLVTDADGFFRIVVRDLEAETHFAVAHELGHWALDAIARWKPPNEEAIANRLAAAICAPAVIVRAIVKREGRSVRRHLRPLARTTGLSQTAANLRASEVLDDERAVVTAAHQNVMVRSAGRYPWEPGWVIQVALKGERDERLETTKLHGGIDAGRVALRLK